MQKKSFRGEEILKILKAGEQPDLTIREVCRQYGIAEKTFYKWRREYGGVESPSMLKELKALRQENQQLKKIVADQALDIHVLKDVNSKKW